MLPFSQIKNQLKLEKDYLAIKKFMKNNKVPTYDFEHQQDEEEDDNSDILII